MEDLGRSQFSTTIISLPHADKRNGMHLERIWSIMHKICSGVVYAFTKFYLPDPCVDTQIG